MMSASSKTFKKFGIPEFWNSECPLPLLEELNPRIRFWDSRPAEFFCQREIYSIRYWDSVTDGILTGIPVISFAITFDCSVSVVFWSH